MFGDIRFALRGLRRNPGFLAAALLILAIGIGANTAVFSVVYGVLLRPLQYREPERLVTVLTQKGGPVSPANYLDFRAQTTAVEGLEAAQAWGGDMQTPDGARMVPGIQMTAGMFALLGIAPERGRVFRPGDDDARNLLVISHSLWEKQFGSDGGAIGGPVRVNDKVYTLIGVMPPEFRFAPFWQTQAEMWAPLDLSKHRDDRGGQTLRLFGRLKPGAGIDEARAQLTAIAKRLENSYPESNKGLGVAVSPLLDKVTGPVRPTLILLSATALLVLLIACVNLANLWLTRAIGRRGEVALRLAMGASRARILREMTVESLLVSIAGGMGGVFAARWALRLLPLVLPPGSLPRLSEIRLLPVSFAFAAAAAITTGVVCAVFSALESSRVDVNENLRQAGHGVVRAAWARGRGFLIAAEMSIALLLLVCAGLMIRTLGKLNGVNPGFDARNVISMSVFAPPEEKGGARRIATFERVRRTLAGIPGVERVSGINHLPIGGDVWTLGYSIPGRPAPPPGEEPGAVYRVALPAYFGAMRIPLLRGRDFAETDKADSLPVAIVNEKLARAEWPAGEAVGKTIEVPGIPDGADNKRAAVTRFTIVGVVSNARQGDWISEPAPEFYVPYLQHADAWDAKQITFVLRGTGNAKAITTEVASRVRAISGQIAVSDVAAMDNIIGDKLWRSRAAAALLTIFACIALALAGVGVYGVIAHSVRQRAREIAIRLALGAPASHILRIGIRESGGAVLFGMAAGIAASLAATRLIAALLYQVQPEDPVTFVTVVLVLGGAALVAAVIPAWGALRRNQEIVLRQE